MSVISTSSPEPTDMQSTDSQEMLTKRDGYATVDCFADPAAVDSVADRHWRTCSPEFVEWIAESAGNSINHETFACVLSALTQEAHRVQQAKGVADAVREQWCEFVAQAKNYSWWPMARNIAREVRRES